MINSISAQIVRVVLRRGSEVEDSSSVYTTEEVVGCVINLFFLRKKKTLIDVKC